MFSELHNFNNSSGLKSQILLGWPHKSQAAVTSHILGDYSNCINTFIYAYKEDRIRRIMKLYKLEEKQAADKIKKTDRERKLYYEARTGREWGGIEANSMMFNVSLLGIDGVTDALEAIYRKWETR